MVHLRSLAVLVALGVLAPASWAGNPPPGSPPPAVATAGDKVNINTATVKELQSLSGIGARVAEKIVQYRAAHGPFKKPDDLRKVEGVGSGLLERNRERIVVK